MPKQGGPSPEARYTYMTKKASTRRRVEISVQKYGIFFVCANNYVKKILKHSIYCFYCILTT